MPELMIPRADCEAIWRAFETGQKTVDRLVEVTGCVPGIIRAYLDQLIRYGYVALGPFGTAVGGEILPQFILIRKTGREAPGIEHGAFVDRNLPKWRSVDRARVGTLTAVVRIAVAEFDDEFSFGDLRRAMKGKCDEKALRYAVKGMARTGELLRTGRRGWYRYQEDERLTAVVDTLRAQPAYREFSYRDLRDELPGGLAPWEFCRALEAIKAEGYTVGKRIKFENRLGIAVYRIIPPAG